MIAVKGIILFLLLCVPVCADLATGKQAWNSGDYATAFKELLPIANQGDPVAQMVLGVMFDQGRGVPQDYKEAVKWYRLAAEQGNAAAQFDLGTMSAQGRGVPQDDKEAV